MSRTIGYARVSTAAQDLQLHSMPWPRRGASRSSPITPPGAKSKRPGLDTCVKELEARRHPSGLGPGPLDAALGRLGRGFAVARRCGLRSLQDGHIDTTTATGELMFHAFSSLAQKRTTGDLPAARAHGRLGGRRPITGANSRVQAAKRLNQHSLKLTVPGLCVVTADV